MTYNVIIALICCLLSYESYANPSISKSNLPIGTVRMFAGLQVPENWLRCDGSNVYRAKYSKLFAVIGTLFGVGDHVTTFGLPDFRGRFPLGNKEEQSSNFKTGGESKHALTEDELPAHRHDTGTIEVISAGNHTHSYTDPGHNHGGSTGEAFLGTGQYWGSYHGGGAGLGQHSHTIPMGLTKISINFSGQHSHALKGVSGAVGKGKELSLIPPFQSINFIILYQ